MRLLLDISLVKTVMWDLNVPRFALRTVGGGVASCIDAAICMTILPLPRLGVAMRVSMSVTASSSSVTSPFSSLFCLISSWKSNFGLMDERVSGRRASWPACRSSWRSSPEASSSSSVGASDGGPS